jgi:hypothetical protein
LPIVEKATTLEITTKEEMLEATDILSKLNIFCDNITEEKEKITKPLNQALKAERARWKPLEEQYEAAIASIRAKMGKYQTEEIKRQADEAKAIADRRGEGKGYLKVETAVRQIAEIEKVEKKVTTDAGSVSFKAIKMFEVMDVTMLPKEYILPDETAIRQAMKEGKELAGVRYWVEQVPVNNRK